MTWARLPEARPVCKQDPACTTREKLPCSKVWSSPGNSHVQQLTFDQKYNPGQESWASQGLLMVAALLCLVFISPLLQQFPSRTVPCGDGMDWPGKMSTRSLGTEPRVAFLHNWIIVWKWGLNRAGLWCCLTAEGQCHGSSPDRQNEARSMNVFVSLQDQSRIVNKLHVIQNSFREESQACTYMASCLAAWN